MRNIFITHFKYREGDRKWQDCEEPILISFGLENGEPSRVNLMQVTKVPEIVNWRLIFLNIRKNRTRYISQCGVSSTDFLLRRFETFRIAVR